MSEIEQLEQVIANLEDQRATLGHAIVETGLKVLREKLADLKKSVASSTQRRTHVTVLFADVSGFTTMSEAMDAEEITEIMNALWAELDGIITEHGGYIDKHIGDALMAIWGAVTVHEDDAERAVHAALAMQTALVRFRREQRIPISMRIGLNSGLVILGAVGTTHEFTAIGDAVNLAARVEQAAPIDGILITHDTYRHIRGIFNVQAQLPMIVKGKSTAIQTYLIQRAKPRAFRMRSRGIEGIETSLIGREAELRLLQSRFIEMLERDEMRLVTVVGEAGVGKSRLVTEFERWLELRPETILFFKGHASPHLQSSPYSILRDMFADRFEILDSDSATTALQKFREGMGGILSTDCVDMIGHWVGFDFSCSPTVHSLRNSAEFGNLARSFFINYLQILAHNQPVVIVLEDLHWADHSSLDVIAHLVTDVLQATLLVIGLARPSLEERRPGWVKGHVATELLELRNLSRASCQLLVEEILQRVEVIPKALGDMIVERAEGNPFYAEELIKMLIEQAVIERRADDPFTWHVHLSRLRQTQIPSTLTELLQARLDSLLPEERVTLQQASVIGRVFWEETVIALTDAQTEQVATALGHLGTRELLYRREHSAFAETREYCFHHALLRDVTYETVLLKLRRIYHAQIADWLETHAGERLGEYCGLIAEHLERADRSEQAITYLQQAGERALTSGALQESVSFFRRALKLITEQHPNRASLLVQLGRALMWLSDYHAAQQHVEAALTLAQQHHDYICCATAFRYLGVIAYVKGDWPVARTYIGKSLVLARQLNDKALLAHALRSLGWIDIREGAFAQAEKRLCESQDGFQHVGDTENLTDVLSALGTISAMQDDFEQAQTFYLKSLKLARQHGHRIQEGAALCNLGEVARRQRDYLTARKLFQEALDLHRQIGHKRSIALEIGNLGHVAYALNDHSAALSYYREAITIAWEIQLLPCLLENLVGWAGVLVSAKQFEQALTLLGFVINQPTLHTDAQFMVEQVMTHLCTLLSPDEIEMGLTKGQTLSLKTVVTELLK